MTQRIYIGDYTYTLRPKNKGYWLLSIYYKDDPKAFFQETYNDKKRAAGVAQFRIKMHKRERGEAA